MMGMLVILGVLGMLAATVAAVRSMSRAQARSPRRAIAGPESPEPKPAGDPWEWVNVLQLLG